MLAHNAWGSTGKKRETAGSLPFGYAQDRNDKPEKQRQKQKNVYIERSNKKSPSKPNTINSKEHL
jgi:hypothetical protein